MFILPPALLFVGPRHFSLWSAELHYLLHLHRIPCFLFEPFHRRTSHFEGVCRVPVGSTTLCTLCWTSLSAAAATTDLFGLPANTWKSSSHLLGTNLAREGFAEGSLTLAPPACAASPHKMRKNVGQQKHLFLQSFPTEDTVTCLPDSKRLFFFFSFASLFSFRTTSPKSHANTLGGSICLDWIDGPPAFFSAD